MDIRNWYFGTGYYSVGDRAGLIKLITDMDWLQAKASPFYDTNYGVEYESI